jgi:RNA polymerase sigma-70 factor (ECF subfamily)
MGALGRKSIHDAMVRLSDGDRAAFPVLMEQLWPLLLAFAQRGLQHEQDAEDVAQEVFLRICSRISDFDRERDGLSWAFGIAAHEIMTQRRRRQRRREELGAAEVPLLPDPAPSQEDAIIKHDLAAALSLVVGRISEEDRTSLGIGPAGPMAALDTTLRKRRQRALERLRAVWRKVYGQP